MKNKKTLLGILAITLFVTIAGTLAYFTDTVNIDNLFTTADFNVEAIEEFISPSNWKPGDETSKVVSFKNNSDIAAKVRVKLEEEWISNNDVMLPLTQNGNRIALINFVNTSNWVKSGEYYYYTGVLNKNDVTPAIINKVTFNPSFVAGTNCHTVGNTTTCTSTGTEYNEATYKLKLTAEFVQSQVYETEWNITNTEINNPTKYILTFESNGGGLTSYKMTVTNGQTYNLPTPVRSGYTFDGWYLNSDFTNKITNGDTISLSEDKIVFAKWVSE